MIPTAIVHTISNGKPDKEDPTRHGKVTITIILVRETVGPGKVAIRATELLRGEGITMGTKRMIIRRIKGLRIIRTMTTTGGTIAEEPGTSTGKGGIIETRLAIGGVAINGDSVR